MLTDSSKPFNMKHFSCAVIAIFLVLIGNGRAEEKDPKEKLPGNGKITWDFKGMGDGWKLVDVESKKQDLILTFEWISDKKPKNDFSIAKGTYDVDICDSSDKATRSYLSFKAFQDKAPMKGDRMKMSMKALDEVQLEKTAKIRIGHFRPRR